MATKKPAGEKFLDTRQAADLLGVSIEKMRRFIREGRLPVVEFGPRTRRIPLAALEEMAREKVAK